MKKLFWNEVTEELTFEKVVPFILLISGIIGLIASFILVHDEFARIQNPRYVPACDLNPIISCGDVMNAKIGHVFGMPAPVIGVATFSALATIGIAMLAGAKFKRWFWWGVELGVAGGFLFAHWLLLESIYRIQALCPFCLTVDVVTITTFWYVTLYNIEKGFIKVSRSERQAVTKFAQKHHLDILLLWFLAIIVVILNHFWYFFGKYI